MLVNGSSNIFIHSSALTVLSRKSFLLHAS